MRRDAVQCSRDSNTLVLDEYTYLQSEEEWRPNERNSTFLRNVGTYLYLIDNITFQKAVTFSSWHAAQSWQHCYLGTLYVKLVQLLLSCHCVSTLALDNTELWVGDFSCLATCSLTRSITGSTRLHAPTCFAKYFMKQVNFFGKWNDVDCQSWPSTAHLGYTNQDARLNFIPRHLIYVRPN